MDLALIDIDGVLANDEHRVEFALRKAWTSYFAIETMRKDSPLEEGRTLIRRLLEEGWEVQYLTGRREDRRAVTTAWLVSHGFPAVPLHMRSRDEKMPLANFKRERIQQMKDSGEYDAVVLYDDDPEVIRLVRETFGNDHGIHCTWYLKRTEMIKTALT